MMKRSVSLSLGVTFLLYSGQRMLTWSYSWKDRPRFTSMMLSVLSIRNLKLKRTRLVLKLLFQSDMLYTICKFIPASLLLYSFLTLVTPFCKPSINDTLQCMNNDYNLIIQYSIHQMNIHTSTYICLKLMVLCNVLPLFGLAMLLRRQGTFLVLTLHNGRTFIWCPL